MRHRSERGSALAAVLILTMLMAALVVSLGVFSSPYLKTSARFNQNLYAIYAAEALLERTRMQIATSAYDTGGNMWLEANSSAGGTVAFSNIAVGQAVVNVTVYNLGGNPTLYQAQAVATYSDASVKLCQEFRGRDNFAKYMFYVEASDLNVGSTTVEGFVYVGGNLNNYYGNALYTKSVDVVGTVTYNSGASSSNTSYTGTPYGLKTGAPVISMPPVTAITSLSSSASGPFNISGDAQISFSGNNVTIVSSSGTTTNPIPSNGLIYVGGNITGLSGDTSGRCTIACAGNVTLTNRLRYTDPAGNLEYLLYKSGTPVADNGSGDTNAWTAANGYTYSKNPAYSPNLAAPPTLGIMAVGTVEVAASAPYNMEQMAAVYSSTSHWDCNLGAQKGNLKVVGSLVTHTGGWRYDGAGDGYAKSGEYVYDNSLLSNPPPWFLQVNVPVYGARHQEN